jgi:hypothetical protein
LSAVDDLPAEAGAGNGGLPIDDYRELTVARVLPLLPGLSRTQLWQVHEYERRHANRLAILEAIEQALG